MFSGEEAMQALMFSTIISPANRILTAIANAISVGRQPQRQQRQPRQLQRHQSPPWSLIADGDAPITDFLFQTGRSTAVIEVKKPNVLNHKTIHDITKDHGQFSIAKMLEDSKVGLDKHSRQKVPSLISSKQPRVTVRGSRKTATKALE